MSTRYPLIALLVLSLTSCRFFGGERVRGDGHVVTQSRNTGSFTKVDVGGSFQVHIRQEANAGIRIETDENLMQYIDVHNEGGTLVIEEKKGFNLKPTKDLIVYVSSPEFTSIEVSGASDIIGDGPISGSGALRMSVSGSGDIKMDVNLAKVETHISGSGSVQLRGRAQEFEAEVSGSGDVNCFDLETETTRLDLSGSSDAEVNASKHIDIDASGSSNISYKGSATVNQKISGSGSVKKIG